MQNPEQWLILRMVGLYCKHVYKVLFLQNIKINMAKYYDNKVILFFIGMLFEYLKNFSGRLLLF